MRSKNIMYIMGVMGHYVGDAAQPLHETIHHHGWVGENPNGYSTRSKIHGDVDGYFVHLDTVGFKELAAHIHTAKSPAEELGMTSGDTFVQIIAYLQAQERQVVPLYELEKAGKLLGGGESGKEGKEFLSKQLVTGGQMLGDMWYAAWQGATEDKYLSGQLARRSHAPGSGDK